jgi:hypothetical protein
MSVYINNSIINKLKETHTNTDAKYIINLLSKKEVSIDLTASDIFYQYNTIDTIPQQYSLVNKVNKNNYFILYPNNFNNLNIIKNLYYINLDIKSIKILGQKGANLFITTIENKSILEPLIKNYNYKIIKYLIKKEKIDIRFFNNNIDLKNFIIYENINNINKIFNNESNKKYLLDTIFSNINIFLYDNIVSLIISDNTLGNNILINLKESFHLSTYLILKRLNTIAITDISDTIDPSDTTDSMKFFNTIKDHFNNININQFIFLKKILEEYKPNTNINIDVENIIYISKTFQNENYDIYIWEIIFKNQYIFVNNKTLKLDDSKI